MKRARGADSDDSSEVKKEEILDRTTNEYEAIVAIAKEARRLNAVPGVFLEKDERAIPKAVENFVGGRVEYIVEGDECAECARPGGAGKAAGKAAGKRAGKTARRSTQKGGKKK